MPDKTSRRQVVTGASTLLGAAILGPVVLGPAVLGRSDSIAQTPAASGPVGLGPVGLGPVGLGSVGLGSAAGLAKRTAAFLSGLDANQRKAASSDWDSSGWQSWSYYGVGGYTKPGLRLEQMTAAQKDQAWLIFAEVLSPAGLLKANNVMILQDVLAESGDGVGQRSRERFSVTVFGKPEETGPWGLRLEGHHLSLSFAVRDGVLISVTPAAFAVRPNRVTTGKHAGLKTLTGEELLARRVFADLSPKLQARASVQSRHLSNILSDAGRERSNAKKVGLALAEMATAQQDLVWQLVETYAVEPYAGAIAMAQKTRVRSGDAAAVHFAWYGPNVDGKSFGYRIIGDAFVIELGCIDGDAQHIHPIYNDLGNVLGRTV